MTPPHEGGKDKVIDEVEWYAEQGEERWGIVDMDSDFQSERVNLIQLTDTSPDCTLFWSIIRTASMDLMDLMGQMINECQKDGQLASDLHARLEEEGPEIIERMRLGTSRRLYLDHQHNHGFAGSHDQFSKQNGKGIERAGINDHVFEREMASMFDSAGQEITLEKIVRKLHEFPSQQSGRAKRKKRISKPDTPKIRNITKSQVLNLQSICLRDPKTKPQSRQDATSVTISFRTLSTAGSTSSKNTDQASTSRAKVTFSTGAT